MLYCGFAEREITPEIGMQIPGYFEIRINEGVFDPLFAKAVVFENGENICALVVLDTELFERTDALDIRRKTEELCGIDANNVFVWATHTHTGGPTDGTMQTSRDKKYINFMTSQAAEAIAAAYEARRPAKIGSVAGEIKDVVYIRRFFMKSGSVAMSPRADLNPDIAGVEGEPDETFTVARIEDAESGEILGFISSLGLHLDTIGASSASADYPGVLAKLIREKFGDKVKSVFFTGPCGNTNHLNVYDNSTYDGKTMRFRIGEKLFAKFCELNEKITCADGELEVRSRRYVDKLRGVTPEQVKWAQDVLAGKPNDLYDEIFAMEIFAKPLIDIQNRIEESVEIEIAAVKVGDLTIISWPGEVFVEFGMEVRKAMEGENVIIGELSGGSVFCYICTRRGHENGGYEPMATCDYCLEPDGGYHLVEQTIKMLKK